MLPRPGPRRPRVWPGWAMASRGHPGPAEDVRRRRLRRRLHLARLGRGLQRAPGAGRGRPGAVPAEASRVSRLGRGLQRTPRPAEDVRGRCPQARPRPRCASAAKDAGNARAAGRQEKEKDAPRRCMGTSGREGMESLLRHASRGHVVPDRARKALGASRRSSVAPH